MVVSSATFMDFSAPNGAQSWYHRLGSGVKGIMYYLGGDYQELAASPLNYPDAGILAGLTRVARAKGLTLVAVNSPEAADGRRDVTWWREADRNGEFFRALHHHVVEETHGVDHTTVWLCGYSGGADFIAGEVLADGLQGMTAGGAVLVGGGGARAPLRQSRTARAVVRRARLHWFVGEQDVAGRSVPVSWSALGEAREGERVYRDAGFHTSLNVMPGLGHERYEISRYVSEAIPAAERTGSRGAHAAPRSRHTVLLGLRRMCGL